MSLNPATFNEAKDRANRYNLKRREKSRSKPPKLTLTRKPLSSGKGAQGAISRKQGLSQRPAKRLKAGKKTKRWNSVRAQLKKAFAKREITRCEFGFIRHECWDDNGLSFAHSHKRTDPHFQMYAVALACLNAHRILDEVFSHDQMAIAVFRAIESRGGVIRP